MSEAAQTLNPIHYTAPELLKSARKIWIISPVWDSFWMLSGISLTLLLLILRPFGLDQKAALVLFAAERLMALTHSWSTTYLVTASPLFKELRQKDSVRFLKIPILIFLVSLVLGILVAKIAQIPEDASLNKLSAVFYFYIGLYMLGHFWHFGRQDFGVLSLYRARAGQFSNTERKRDLLYSQIMMYLIQPILYIKAFPKFPISQMFSWFISLEFVANQMAPFAIIAAGILFSLITLFELKNPNRSIPKLIYYGIILFHPTLLYFLPQGTSIFWYISYLWSHWLIATGLSMKINTHFNEERGSSHAKALMSHVAVIGGIALSVWLLTKALAPLALLSKDIWDVHEILRTLEPNMFTIIGLFYGFILGEQLVHYYCDRQLFRFKNEDVRKIVSPHL
jgi:hypothetical protein